MKKMREVAVLFRVLLITCGATFTLVGCSGEDTDSDRENGVVEEQLPGIEEGEDGNDQDDEPGGDSGQDEDQTGGGTEGGETGGGEDGGDTGGGEETPVEEEPQPDPEAELLKQAQITYDQQCFVCHGKDGVGIAKGTSLIAGDALQSEAFLAEKITTMPPGTAVAKCVGDCAVGMSKLIMAFQGDADAAYHQGFSTMSNQALLRKTALNLVDRMPTDEEIALVETSGIAGLEQVMDAMMETQPFYDRVKEIFDDILRVTAFANDALELEAVEALVQNAPENNNVRNRVNNMITQEPLALIEHVIKNKKPLTEIVNADYVVVNEETADVYGVNAEFIDGQDTGIARIPGFPHAGIMTTPAFLQRTPSSESNLQRARSRVTYSFFLGVDVFALSGSRELEEESPAQFPTRDDPNCNTCHEVVDPVANLYKDWTDNGSFNNIDDTDIPEYVFASGFNGIARPADQADTELNWFADQVVTDFRFARAMTHHMLEGLTGQKLILPADDKDAGLVVAANEQRRFTLDLAKTFIESNYEIRTLVKEIVKSPYFRADGVSQIADPEEHKLTAKLTMLSPDRFARRSQAIFGMPWEDNDGNSLMTLNNFGSLFGGVDFATDTERLTDVNTMIGTILERFANDISCKAVAVDFEKNADDRLLFPDVNLDDDAEAQIRAGLVHLHQHILGEFLTTDSTEIDESFALFSTVKDSQNRVQNGCAADGPNNANLAAWMGVVAYLTADINYLYD